ncbi:MAG: hypothetical protein R3C19_27175 [Planctomycetaceae bacterium]
MTIQRTLLCSLAGILITASANAQCRRTRPVIIEPVRPIHHGHHGIDPHRTVLLPAPVLEVPPAPSEIHFGACEHVDQLAAELEVLMNELCLDLYYNYSHNPGFQETYTEAYSLYQTARLIHAAEHNFDRATVQRQLTGVDALFHHVQDDVHGWTRIPRRQIGTLGIIAKINLAEEALHHLMDDVGVSALPIREEPPAPSLLEQTALSVAPAPQFLR